MSKFLGKKTKIVNIIGHICFLEIDNATWQWDVNWIEPYNNLLLTYEDVKL